MGRRNAKTSTRHPYAAIEHRVIDSEAFRDLKPSAVLVLLLMCRQLNGGNNGQLQATYAYMRTHGIGSEHTLQDAIRQLISHGLIYRTRSHGANGAWARYAVTWLPIQDTSDLFLAGFRACAWRDWTPHGKKPPRKKCRTDPAETAVSPGDFLQKVQDSPPQKMQTMNLMPCSSAAAVHGSPRRGHTRPPLTSPYAIRLMVTADRGGWRTH